MNNQKDQRSAKSHLYLTPVFSINKAIFPKQNLSSVGKGQINIRTHSYFPFQFKALAVGFTPLIVIPIVPWLSLGLFVVAALILTTHYRLSVDMASKTYREYLWIAGFKNGSEAPFDRLDYLFTKKVQRHSEFGFVARLKTSGEMIMAYLRTSDGRKLFIGESQNMSKILKKVSLISKDIGIPVRETEAPEKVES